MSLFFADNKTFPDMKRNEEDPQKLIEAVLEFKD